MNNLQSLINNKKTSIVTTLSVCLIVIAIISFQIYILYIFYNKDIEGFKAVKITKPPPITIDINNDLVSSRKTIDLGIFKATSIYSLQDKNPKSLYSSCGDLSIPKKGHKEVNKDYTDISVRALLLSNGKIMLSTGHLVPNKMLGTNFDNLKKECNPIWYSEFVKEFDKFKFNEWNSSLYTKDGKNILSITQHDWHAGKIDSLKTSMKKLCSDSDNCDRCLSDPFNCWWLALTIQKSNDSGNTFKKMPNYILAAPDIQDFYKLKSEKARLQYYYTEKGSSQAFGYYQTTNIIKDLEKGDYYFVTRARLDKQDTDARFVFCKANSNSDLFNPMSWKGQDLNGEFNADIRKSQGLAPEQFSKMVEIRTLVFNTYLNKYMILGFASKNDIKYVAAMFSKTNDILTWDKTVYKITDAEFVVGNERIEIRYPTLIDHNYMALVRDFKDRDERRNFDVCGNNPYVYCTIRKTDVNVKKETNDSLEVIRFQINISQ